MPEEKARRWEGKATTVSMLGLSGAMRNRDIRIDGNEDLGRKLALSLARLKQTTFALPDEVQELLDALNFVLVGDPQSRAAHRHMEVGKGMTPDGG